MAIAIEIDQVVRAYGAARAVDGVSLSIAAGEFFTLLGSSGCGKSTLLKLIGGFETPTSGRILFDGQDMGAVPANRRPVNTVFQGLGLFPHMSVAENVGYGLKLKGMAAAARAAKVADALELVQLGGFGARDVTLLSGGQRQRVALARALVMEPGILLLDEPLTGLDERLRQQMRDEFGRLHKRTGATFILVTHNQDEAVSLSDRMAVMHAGRIEQVDRPAAFYRSPANAFVARFVGIDALLRPERILAGPEGGEAVIAGQRLPVRLGGASDPATSVIALRPDRLSLDPLPEGQAGARLELTLMASTFRGLSRDVTLAFADGQSLTLAIGADKDLPPEGSRMTVTLAPDAAVAIPA